MAVRNFYVEVEHSSRQNNVGTGPQGKAGWLEAGFYIRDQGVVTKALAIKGQPDVERGTLHLYIKNCLTNEVWEIETER